MLTSPKILLILNLSAVPAHETEFVCTAPRNPSYPQREALVTFRRPPPALPSTKKKNQTPLIPTV